MSAGESGPHAEIPLEGLTDLNITADPFALFVQMGQMRTHQAQKSSRTLTQAKRIPVT